MLKPDCSPRENEDFVLALQDAVQVDDIWMRNLRQYRDFPRQKFLQVLRSRFALVDCLASEFLLLSGRAICVLSEMHFREASFADLLTNLVTAAQQGSMIGILAISSFVQARKRFKIHF